MTEKKNLKISSWSDAIALKQVRHHVKPSASPHSTTVRKKRSTFLVTILTQSVLLHYQSSVSPKRSRSR